MAIKFSMVNISIKQADFYVIGGHSPTEKDYPPTVMVALINITSRFNKLHNRLLDKK